MPAVAPADARWQAVLARDAGADGAFVYGVASTGIFCRPTCPARRPRREQVVFFAGPAEAARAGFRACRRCHPAGASPAAALVALVCDFLDGHAGERVTLARLAEVTGLSPQHLQRTFRRATGVSPLRYGQAQRLARARAELRAGAAVADAVHAAGYGAPSGLYAQAGAHFGMAPGAFRRGGPGTRIDYALADCPLGVVLVAATAVGVCRVLLGDSALELETALAQEYPRAERRRDEAGLGAEVGAVLARLQGGEPAGLRLDVRATAFQQRVWEALRAIPPGETRTYGELARSIGRPGAARAVGQACASNPLAVVIPCHRAVRADGGPGGYRWGAERKRALLHSERLGEAPPWTP